MQKARGSGIPLGKGFETGFNDERFFEGDFHVNA
jgi:hypothetical protein